MIIKGDVEKGSSEHYRDGYVVGVGWGGRGARKQRLRCASYQGHAKPLSVTDDLMRPISRRTMHIIV